MAEATRTPCYASVAEIRQLVEQFEEAEVPLAEFKHGAHLVVALWYLTRWPEQEAVAIMCNGLQRLIARNGLNAYHETITRFWLRRVRRFLDAADKTRTLPELANELTATYGDARLIFDYYSQPLLQTPQAKTIWCAPDLKPLD